MYAGGYWDVRRVAAFLHTIPYLHESYNCYKCSFISNIL